MTCSLFMPISTPPKLRHTLLYGQSLRSEQPSASYPNRRASSSPVVRAAAALPNDKELVLRAFQQRRALKIIAGLHNFDKENVAAVVTAADKGGATHVDIACDSELVKLATCLTSLPLEIGNYDSFYDMGITFSPKEILNLTKQTRRLLPSVTLSVTVPHNISLPDQIELAEMLEQEGADVIQTEGGKCAIPSDSGVLGLIQKATPTLASAYCLSRAVRIPVMCSSGLSAVTVPMAIAAGAAGVGVGSAINKLNDVVAMIAAVRSIANALNSPETTMTRSSISGKQMLATDVL
uniref:Uncharacterized protein ycf23 n=1 Tax=Kalanchoe fedtschenkoi TaxID=63787 RepID=A0A7N0TK22_KALFE